MGSFSFEQKVVSSEQPSFIKFYAPWCGHCKTMKPAFDKLIQNTDGNRITIDEVDCTQHRPLCEQHNVSGYPTLLFFSSNGVDYEKYTGKREYEDMLSYLEEKLDGPSDETSNEE